MKFVEKATYKIKNRGEKVRGVRVKGKKMTRSDIKKLVKEYAEKVQEKSKKPKQFLVTLLYPDQWHSGRLFRAGEEPQLFAYEYYDDFDMMQDPATYPEFWIYTLSAPEQAGGNGEFNDCLYKCLKTLATGKLPWSQPSLFKKFLGIERKDKVDIKYIPIIEQKLKRYAINVTGDYTYQSPIKSKLTMHLILENGHYSYDLSKSNTELTDAFNISSKERKPIMIHVTKDEIKAYDGIEEKQITALQYYLIKTLRDADPYKGYLYVNHPKDDLITKKGFLYVPYTDEDIAQHKRRSLKECFDEWIIIADELKEKTKGLINMYMTGSYQNTAIRLFHFYSQAIHPEPITQFEAEFIKNATAGAIAFSEHYEGPLHSYDFVSHYPAIMCDGHFMVPICEGKFETLEELDLSRITTGIYRCIITPTIKDHHKVFKLNETNYYTSTDIKRAHELGFKIELITDGKINALKYYRQSCLTGSEVFAKTVECLYELKQKKIRGAKMIINNIWGKLCQTKTRKQVIQDQELELEDGDTFFSIYPRGNKETVFKTIKKREQFYTSYARIKPFLLAEGRAKLSRVIEPIMDNVIKSHTDSIYAKVKTKYEDQGEQLGQLSYKGHCENATVTYLNVKVQGKFS